MDESRWTFADPPDLAVITVVQVPRDGASILFVTHDADDGGWQFLTGETVDRADSMVVALREMIQHDPSLVKLADLPVGWRAWRKSKDSDWERAALP